MPTRKASAVWEGGLQSGKGTFKGEETTGITGEYSVGSRFADAPGSNPEELLAAAEAACFSMFLSAQLEKNGTPATRVETEAACTVETVGGGPKITTMKLTVRAKVPNIDDAKFQELVVVSRDGCPVSGALKGNVAIDVDASLT
jgi:osmotically inducible protein OsmC